MSGILFRPELAKLVARGAKTQTRRPIRVGQRARVKGRTYAVQPGRGQPAICRIRISDVRREPLGEIDERDARREGFPTRDAFLNYWRDLHHAGTRPDLLDLLERIAALDLLSDELRAPKSVLHPGLRPGTLTGRLNALRTLGLAAPPDPDTDRPRWAVTEQGADVLDGPEHDLRLHGQLDRDVWVVTFHLERDEPRLLAPAARPAGNTSDRAMRDDRDDLTDHGYVHTLAHAISDEPEAVDLDDPDDPRSWHWGREADARRRADQDRRHRAHRLRRNAAA